MNRQATFKLFLIYFQVNVLLPTEILVYMRTLYKVGRCSSYPSHKRHLPVAY